MGVSKNNGTPKSSILIGFSMKWTVHFGGFTTPIFGNTHISIFKKIQAFRITLSPHNHGGREKWGQTEDEWLVSQRGHFSTSRVVGKSVTQTILDGGWTNPFGKY